jgi:nucleotide-binding universal stress UspA family protein
MKTEISTLLLATDFQPGSRLVLDYAVSLAGKLHAKLVIVNAFELDPEANSVENVEHIPSRTRREAEAKLLAFAAGSIRAGIQADTALVEGPVLDAILKAIQTFKADLLVLGTQGVHRGLDHLLIGSNTEALMLRSTCPTLTVGPHALATMDRGACFKKVVYISNFRPASAYAAPFALELSRALALDIEIHQVVREPAQGEKEAPLKKRVEEYCAELRTLLPDVAETWCSPDFQMSQIVSPQAVLEMSQDSSLLMVVGVHGAPFLERHLRTSYPYRLLANAVCPIITVRSQGMEYSAAPSNTKRNVLETAEYKVC